MRDRMKNSPLLTQGAKTKSSRVAVKPDRRRPALSIRLLLENVIFDSWFDG